MNYRLDDKLALLWMAKHKILMARCFKSGSWIKKTSTHSHDLAPLLHILPHGVDDVMAHVLPSSAFLPHPDQTHPVRAEQSTDSRQPDKPSVCQDLKTRTLKRSARKGTRVKEQSGLNRQHLWPAADYHRISFLQFEGQIHFFHKHCHMALVSLHFYICELLLYKYCRW